MNQPIVTPGIYRHHKGQLYRVLGTAQHSETLELMVVYQALYGTYGLWVRPATMFLEAVELHGEHVPRFSLEQADAEGPIGGVSAQLSPLATSPEH